MSSRQHKRDYQVIGTFFLLFPFLALPPRLKEMKSQESAAGSKLVLRCETSSEYSSLKFKWFKNGNELNRKNKPQNIKIQKRPGKSELRINKASLADSGEYMCKVISKLGNDSASANITIVDANGKRHLLCAISQSLRGAIKVDSLVCEERKLKNRCEASREGDSIGKN
ncbi:hypothetical protein E2I00_004351 [Balaenoptera physalus]|uniref:Ig-like domain-containing protein n=1 Tax=Balaenoptera physalus TaxID=9770 RepID=A0A643CAF4_BALPH|nr:hypothetical protein E2I00_004351 [Balaenoptera physalus]